MVICEKFDLDYADLFTHAKYKLTPSICPAKWALSISASIPNIFAMIPISVNMLFFGEHLLLFKPIQLEHIYLFYNYAEKKSIDLWVEVKKTELLIWSC
jgi:hypothetical protein